MIFPLISTFGTDFFINIGLFYFVSKQIGRSNKIKRNCEVLFVLILFLKNNMNVNCSFVFICVLQVHVINGLPINYLTFYVTGHNIITTHN